MPNRNVLSDLSDAVCDLASALLDLGFSPREVRRLTKLVKRAPEDFRRILLRD